MKKPLYLICTLLLTITMLSACSPKFDAVELPVQKYVDQLKKPADILAEFDKIDMYAKMDIKDSYTKQTDFDDESDTSIVRYYNGDTLVYTDYIGYGEDMFEYHIDDTTRVSYVDQEGERYSATLTHEDKNGIGYSVWAEGDLNKKLPYGAEFVYINTFDSSGIAPVHVYYVVNCTDKTITPTNAVYKNDKGEYRSYADYRLDGTDETEDELLYGIFDGELGIAGSKELIAEINDIDGDIDVSMKFSGMCKYMYRIDDDGNEHWYVKAPVYVTFENAQARDAFAAKYPNGESGEYTDYYSDDEKEYPYWSGEAVLEISPTAKISGHDKAFDIVTAEFNEARSFLLSVDESGVITELKSGATMRWD